MQKKMDKKNWLFNTITKSRLLVALAAVLLLYEAVVLCCEYGNLTPLHTPNENFRASVSDQPSNNNTVIFTSFEETAFKQRNRIRTFRKNCRRLKCYNDTLDDRWDLFFSSGNKLAGKLVPKIGSTFLIQAFGILNEKETEKGFEKSRRQIHIDGKNFSFKKNFNLQELQNYTVLIMARNPFSRLFSAYIDKVYLPNNINLPRHIYMRNAAQSGKKTCQLKTTFEEFLNYALDDSVERVLWSHYNPTMSKSNCNKLCQIPNIVVVKQESFSEDIDYALKLVGVESKKYNIIHAAMYEKQAQSTISGVVKTVYTKMKQNYHNNNFRTMVSKDCLSWSDIAERMWKSFQIQGYIYDKVDFPHKMFRSRAQYQDAHYLVDVILEEIDKRPLTHEQMVQQRTRAMLNAYAVISEDVIRKIVEKYYLDFSFYEYSHVLP